LQFFSFAHSEDWLSRSYVIAYAVWVYFLPLLTILYSYFQIVKVQYHFRKPTQLSGRMFFCDSI
jgi:hypothetical protein